MSRCWPARLALTDGPGLGARPGGMRADGLAGRNMSSSCANLDRAAHRPARADPPRRPGCRRLLDPAPAPPELAGARSRSTPTSAGPWPRTGPSRPRCHNVLSLQAPHPPGHGAGRPGRLEHDLPDPERRPPVFADGLQPVQLDCSPSSSPGSARSGSAGEAAEQDVQVALAELAAAQLDAVAAVKRAYFDLPYAERAEAILGENRKIADDFRRDRPRRATPPAARPAGRAPGRGR